MSSKVTTLPALTAALKQSAPTVSIATTGTSVQPTSFRPWMTPHSSPPPPTDNTTAPGFTLGPREAATSEIMLAWPCLLMRGVVLKNLCTRGLTFATAGWFYYKKQSNVMQRRDVSCQQLAVNHSDAHRRTSLVHEIVTYAWRICFVERASGCQRYYYYCYHCQARTLNRAVWAAVRGPRASRGLRHVAMMTGTFTGSNHFAASVMRLNSSKVSCPPPLRLSLVTSTKNSEGVTLADGELISLLGRVVPESVDQAFVHHTQLFLYT
ncbi:hypothetical protein INR49_003058 [Caranx melampygus]|nr:hypothetical protein INR49_003058 [Caranx melampygus]